MWDFVDQNTYLQTHYSMKTVMVVVIMVFVCVRDRAVSYTHLDVYKRQQTIQLTILSLCIENDLENLSVDTKWTKERWRPKKTV